MENNLKKTPFVSIVVISKDRHDELEKAIGSLLKIDYPGDRYEIVVVEEGDSPTPLDGVKYVPIPRRNLGLGYARNTGVKNTTGEIIAFTDDDCLVDEAWLKEIVECFRDPEVFGVAGATFAQKGSLIGNCEDILGFPGGGHKRYHKFKGKIGETRLLSGCNCSYRRSVFDELSFKEDGYGRLGADDYLIGITVAKIHKCLYNPKAIVYHKPRGALFTIIRWFSRRRINELLFKEKRNGVKNYKTLLEKPHNIIMVRFFIALMLPLFFGLKGLIALITIAVIWYLFLLMRYFPISKYFNNRLVAFLVPIVKTFMDIGIMVGEWNYLTKSHEKLGMTLNEYKR